MQDRRPIFWPPPPSQTQLRGGLLSRVCGTPSSENVRAYAVVLQTVPTRSSRTAFSSPHLLCQYSNSDRSD